MLPFTVDLRGKTAVVTGGGGVLCSAFAKALAECGAAVAVLDLRAEAAEAVAADIVSAGGKAIGLSCDVLDRASVEAARDRVTDWSGGVQILLNGAGGNHPRATTDRETFSLSDLDGGVRTFFDLKPEDVSFVFDLNFIGTLLPTQVFARELVKGGGTILNVSSMNAYRPLTKIPAYSAAKSAVSNFTQWLAVHFAEAGVRVNAIAPGFFSTAQNRALLFNEDGTPTERTGKILAATPMRRFGQPEDLLGALLYLADEKASGFVTGVVLPVDGGFSAYSGV